MASDVAVVMDRALREAGIPIEGVSIGKVSDRTTWRAVYLPTATDPQKAQGDALLATLDPQDPATLQRLKSEQFTATSRQKDILATCALIVRARGIPAWNGLTLQQKKDATLAEADVWVTIRDFLESNL